VFKKVISENEFDLIIGDESYEVVAALIEKRISLRCRFVAIHDFWGLDTMTSNPQEKLIISRTNRKYMKRISRSLVRFLFVGEAEDVPDRRFGFLRPNRRMRARQNCVFLGYIVPFDPTTYFDKVKIRQDLGYGKEEPLIICSIGGTAVGKELLVLCRESFPLLRNEIPDLRMILVYGPRLQPDSLKLQQGLEVRRYVPNLWKHFAACDLAIIEAGGTTTAELTALRRPFIYFPLEEHFEQQLYITARLERQGAGIRMQYSRTTPESLAKLVLSNLDQEVVYPSIPTDGAKRAANIITCLFEGGSLRV
jgi:UDP-N-acetylglucosamine:LPS N-acetylglucosamine transferase